MIEKVEDWIKFCEGALNVDKSYFFTLFMGEEVIGFIDEIFAPFPNADQLKGLICDYLRFDECGFVDCQNQVCELVKSDVEGKLLACVELNEISLKSKIEGAKIKIIGDSIDIPTLQAVEPAHINFLDALGFYVESNYLLKDEKTYALFESFYGLTNDYQLCYYLGAPLIDSDIKFDAYYKLLRLGYSYVIAGSEILVGKI